MIKWNIWNLCIYQVKYPSSKLHHRANGKIYNYQITSIQCYHVQFFLFNESLTLKSLLILSVCETLNKRTLVLKYNQFITIYCIFVWLLIYLMYLFSLNHFGIMSISVTNLAVICGVTPILLHSNIYHGETHVH